MRLGAYQLVRQIGAGGMGEVWVAHRRVPGGAAEPVAIKRLPRRLAGDPNYRRILLAEARLSSLLHHPNIIRTIDAGEADGEVFIAMELIDGLDLSRVTKLLALQGERLPTHVTAYVIAELLRGLSFAHDLEHEGELISLVHRDVSPHNVMLSSHGAVKLADFGVARLSSEDTSGTHVKGKARYMPPEQLRGDSRSPSVDLFAVGAVLHELLDGGVFRGEAVDDARLLGMAIDGLVPPLRRLREIPPELELLRARLLDPNPEQRPRSAHKALELLRRWPGYRSCPGEIAALVQRLRQREAELSSRSAAELVGFAQEATFLHTNDLELDDSQMAALADVVEAPDQILLALAGDASESATRFSPGVKTIPVDQQTQGTLGTPSELEHTDGGPAATGPGKPRRDPSLHLDLSGESFARHVPTSPNPIVPPSRRLWPLALGIVGVLAVGITSAYALGWWPRPSDPTPPPETTLRRARLVSRGSPLDLGLRDPAMNRLLDDDILFDYRPDPSADPLALLERNEAELALVSLDELLESDSRGMVVALIGLPLAAEALILDSRDHPQLRSLTELESPARIACTAGTAGFARQIEQALALELDTSQLQDDAAVFAELERSDSSLVAGIVREPWISKAVAAGMTVGISGLDLPLANLEVLIASAGVLADDPALIEAVLARYYASRGEPADACSLDAAEASSVAAHALVRERLGDRFDPRFLPALAEPGQLPDRCLARSVARNSARPGDRAEWSSATELGPLPELSASPFEPGQAHLSTSGAVIVEQLAASLRVFNPHTVSVEILGFGEQSGSAGSKLGKQRAEALREALREAGVELDLHASGQPVRNAPPARVRVIVSRTP